MINVFIGYDTKEKVSFSVLSYSIMKNSTQPVSITPIYLDNIKDDFVRERNNLSRHFSLCAMTSSVYKHYYSSNYKMLFLQSEQTFSY